MHPQEDQEHQPLLSGRHRSKVSATPQRGTREDYAGTSDDHQNNDTFHSSTAVDVDHLLATSASSTAPSEDEEEEQGQEPPSPQNAPEPATVDAAAALMPSTTPSSTLRPLSPINKKRNKSVNSLSSPGTTAEAAELPQDLALQQVKWNRTCRMVLLWMVGLALIALLLTFIVSPLVAQRVLDEAVVLQIQQTDISTIDNEGFAVHIKSFISIDPSHDGVFGLTRWTQRLKPELTIEPTTLHLFMPESGPTLSNMGSNNADWRPWRTSKGHVVLGKRMGSFHVPRQTMQMSEESTLLEVTSHVNVTDASVLASFFRSALSESTLDLGVEGELRTRMGRLWYLNLHLTRLVPVEGMKGVQDATLISMALPSEDPQGGVTIEGVARLHNPSSSLSIDLGALTFGVYLSSNDYTTRKLISQPPSLPLAHKSLYSQYKVAELHCSQVKLKAHETVDLSVMGRLLHLDDWVADSPVPLQTALQQQDLKSEKQHLLSGLLSRYIQGEDSLVAIRALPEPGMARWLQVAVSSIVLDIRFPGSTQTDFIEGIDMKQLSLGFDDNSHDTSSLPSSPANSAKIRGRLAARLQLPSNVTFPIKVKELYPTVELFPLSPSLLANSPMARIELPESLPAQSQQDGHKLHVEVSFFDQAGKLVVLPDQEQAFYEFLNGSFSQDEITLGVTGQAKALIETGMGSFELGPIPFTTRTTQKGLGGLTGVPPKLEQIDVVDSTDRSLTIKARLVVTNPSTISASLGSLSFFWAYNGSLIGLATVPNATLQPGPNTVETFGMLDPSLDCRQRSYDPTCDPDQATTAARAFLSGYISGDNGTVIDVLGHAGSTKIPLLQPVISQLMLRSTLPVMEEDFLLSTTMYLFLKAIVLELRNPLDTPIWVLYINGTASYKNEVIGHVRVDFEHDVMSPKPIEIPANDHQDENSGYVKTPRLPVTYELSSVGYEAVKQALGGTLDVDTLCHIKARVGNMVVWIDYHKENIPAKVRRGLYFGPES